MLKIYPAVFTGEDDGYSVSFPDLDGCFTCGDTLEEAMEMAQEAMGLYLISLEERGIAAPPPTSMKIPCSENARPPQTLCKPPSWCIIEALGWRFLKCQEKEEALHFIEKHQSKKTVIENKKLKKKNEQLSQFTWASGLGFRTLFYAIGEKLIVEIKQ